MPHGTRGYPLPLHGSIVILQIKLMYPAESWVRPNNTMDSTELREPSNQLEQRSRAFSMRGIDLTFNDGVEQGDRAGVPTRLIPTIRCCPGLKQSTQTHLP